jgi:ribulose-5-phosphate 4-epimerase/fuculose-1-phosphate aldolase
MDAPEPKSLPSLRARVSDAEWRARVDLAAVYRLVALNGWDDLIYTHISARVPGEPHRYLINPWGVMFNEITASSLVKVDLDCRPVAETPYAVNANGFVLHATIHRARPDAGCVMHTHTDHGIAVAAQKQGLLPISQHALFPLASLAYHDYRGLKMGEDEQRQLAAELGTKNNLILRNHGLLTVGATPADAYLLMHDLERACRIQVLAQAGGAELNRIDPAVARAIAGDVGDANASPDTPLVWAGLLRRLDRIDPSYRD